jgi:hypothetical protein
VITVCEFVRLEVCHIKYKKWSNNAIIDALSHQFDINLVAIISKILLSTWRICKLGMQMILMLNN